MTKTQKDNDLFNILSNWKLSNLEVEMLNIKYEKVYCVNCAHYRPNRQRLPDSDGKIFACTIIRDEQIGNSPIEPAHMIPRHCVYDPKTKNKNNDCQDYVPLILPFSPMKELN